MTEYEMCRRWVDGFDSMQGSMIAKLMSMDDGDWHEVTAPVIGNDVYVYDTGSCGCIEDWSQLPTR